MVGRKNALHEKLTLSCGPASFFAVATWLRANSPPATTSSSKDELDTHQVPLSTHKGNLIETAGDRMHVTEDRSKYGRGNHFGLKRSWFGEDSSKRSVLRLESDERVRSRLRPFLQGAHPSKTPSDARPLKGLKESRKYRQSQRTVCIKVQLVMCTYASCLSSAGQIGSPDQCPKRLQSKQRVTSFFWCTDPPLGLVFPFPRPLPRNRMSSRPKCSRKWRSASGRTLVLPMNTWRSASNRKVLSPSR